MPKTRILKSFSSLKRSVDIRVLVRSNYIPSQMRVILQDFLGLSQKPESDHEHLKAAMKWLCRAQDITGTGGCSASYRFDSGWAQPYPETTGYIISTFLRYAGFSKDDSYLTRAKQMGDWEIEIQLPSGAVRGGSGVNPYPIVFNTGMVILGWTDLYNRTREEKYLNAAVRAANWLSDIIDEDGKWSRYVYNDIPHAYHSRVSWSLLEVYKATSVRKYYEVAEKNIKWVLSNVKGNDWIDGMGFSGKEDPFTHTIAYTLRGLLECGCIFEGEMKDLTHQVVVRIAEKLMLKYELNKKHPNATPGHLSGRFDSNWKSDKSFSCLTGNAQIAIIWLRLFQIYNDARFLNSALKILDLLKGHQNIKTRNEGIRGAIGGSYPIWGDYMTYAYPNWAVKFFADALMIQENVMNELDTDK